LARYRAKELRHQEAVMLLEQAARVKGHEYSAHFELAKVCVSTRHYDKAIDHLDKALKIQPSDELLTYRDAIENLALASE
jgi:tetratricopeptide (TPR) repeat protein